MDKENMTKLFNIASSYLKIKIEYMDVGFEDMENNYLAYFNLVNQNFYYFRINSKFYKEKYSMCEINYLLSILVHECRHYQQLCKTADYTFMKEFIERENKTTYTENWLSYKMEQDAEAIRILFISQVIHKGSRSPEKILELLQYDQAEDIKKIIDENCTSFDKEGARELLSQFIENTKIIEME